MSAVLFKLGFSEASVQSRMAAGTGTFVLAYAVHKLFAPVRISITVVSVPFLVRYCRKVGFFKPPASNPWALPAFLSSTWLFRCKVPFLKDSFGFRLISSWRFLFFQVNVTVKSAVLVSFPFCHLFLGKTCSNGIWFALQVGISVLDNE